MYIYCIYIIFALPPPATPSMSPYSFINYWPLSFQFLIYTYINIYNIHVYIKILLSPFNFACSICI